MEVFSWLTIVYVTYAFWLTLLYFFSNKKA